MLNLEFVYAEMCISFVKCVKSAETDRHHRLRFRYLVERNVRKGTMLYNKTNWRALMKMPTDVVVVQRTQISKNFLNIEDAAAICVNVWLFSLRIICSAHTNL